MSGASVVLVLFFLGVAVAIQPPPVFEHKMEKKTLEVLCEACQATIMELKKVVTKATQAELTNKREKQKRAGAVYQAFEKVCDIKSFGRYAYAPPSMVAACSEVIADHDETLSRYFFTGPNIDDEAARREICVEEGEYCKQLWDPAQKEEKRERSPEEVEAERAQLAKQAKVEEKRKKAEEKAKKKAEEEAAAAAAAEETINIDDAAGHAGDHAPSHSEL